MLVENSLGNFGCSLAGIGLAMLIGHSHGGKRNILSSVAVNSGDKIGIAQMLARNYHKKQVTVKTCKEFPPTGQLFGEIQDMLRLGKKTNVDYISENDI